MPTGLYGAGAAGKSFLSRAPHLAARLGPIAAPTYSLASRISNALRAGHPVRELTAFQPCRLLLLYIPEEMAGEIVCKLVLEPLEWAGKSVLLCGTPQGSLALAPLRERGASIGSLCPIEGARGRFVVEGDGAAVRHAKRLVHDLRGRAVELDTSGMALYMAGLSLVSTMLTPLIAASVECIADAAGGPAGLALAHAVCERTLRAYLHAGRKSWTGALALGDRPALQRELQALSERKPHIARAYRELAILGLEIFSRHPELLEELQQGTGGGRRGRGD